MNDEIRSDTPQDNPHVAQVVERNIRTLLERRHREEHARGAQEKIADAVTTFAGNMKFVYINLFIFGFWIIANLPGSPLPHFDPTYVRLAVFASVEAIFLSTFVLISQNRMTEIADQRADLDLQISLLAEYEVTRLIGLVQEIAAKMDIKQSEDPELGELKKDVAPEHVLDVMEESHQNLTGRRKK